MLGQTVPSTGSSNREGPTANSGQSCMTILYWCIDVNATPSHSYRGVRYSPLVRRIVKCIARTCRLKISYSPYGKPETSMPRAATSVQIRNLTSPLCTDITGLI